jgi:tRNA(fMet)-specific endonuclease VapC
MTLSYLVDTDWVIHWLNGQAPIVKRLDELKEQGLGLSTISLAELYEGVYYSRDTKKSEHILNNFLKGVALVGINEETCQLFGRERGRLRSIGKTISDFDLLIGITARQHDLTLLTNNRRHFENVEGLRIESLT